VKYTTEYDPTEPYYATKLMDESSPCAFIAWYHSGE